MLNANTFHKYIHHDKVLLLLPPIVTQRESMGRSRGTPGETPLSKQECDAERHIQRWMATEQKRYPIQDIR